MKTGTFVFLDIFKNISYYFWMVNWIKNANIFEIEKFHLQGVA